jgi:hypothetical protein
MTASSSGEGEARLMFWVIPFVWFVLACVPRAATRGFSQVFQRRVEPFFGFIRPWLFGRFPKLLNLGFPFREVRCI